MDYRTRALQMPISLPQLFQGSAQQGNVLKNKYKRVSFTLPDREQRVVTSLCASGVGLNGRRCF